MNKNELFMILLCMSYDILYSFQTLDRVALKYSRESFCCQKRDY